jgi:acyl-CoA thioesterase I
MLIAPAISADTSKPFTILVYGDSLSAAYGLEIEQGWVPLLEHTIRKNHNLSSIEPDKTNDHVDSHFNHPNIKFINASISGETSRGGLARFKATLEFSQADLVLLELGANDGLRGYPIKSMRNNLSKMIEETKNSGANVVLIGIRLPPNLGDIYNLPFYETYAQLAEIHQIPLIPFLLEGVAGNDKLMQRDQLHPNALGQPIIADTVFEAISPLLPNF